MNFDTIVNAIKEFFNQPVPIIGITVGSLLMLILTILSKTSIGQKALRQFKKWYEELKLAFTNYKKESDETLQKVKDYYEEELQKAKSEYNALCKFTMSIASNINNVKVKEALADFEKQIDLSKSDYQGYVESKIEEAKKTYELELQAKYENELNHYKAEFDKLLLDYKVLNEKQDIDEEDLESVVVENGEEE